MKWRKDKKSLWQSRLKNCQTSRFFKRQKMLVQEEGKQEKVTEQIHKILAMSLMEQDWPVFLKTKSLA